MTWKPFSIARVGVWLAVTMLCAGHVCRADDCTKHPSSYRQQPGDSADSTHLDVARRWTASGELQINVSAGELRIEPSREAGILRLKISSPGADRTLSGYLRDFRVSGDGTTLTVCVPAKYHPTVTVLVPGNYGGKSQINLGAGTLLLHDDALGGDRELNVGAGKSVLYLDGDRDYSSLGANVGVGRFKDDRPHGARSYGVSARSMSGHGSGTLEVNVGAGEIDLEPSGIE